ncbi:MAG: hypothetical protein AAB907_02355 [Patescibacteria group bacterium]
MSAERDGEIRNKAFRALDKAQRDKAKGKPLPPLDPFAQALCETGDAPAHPHLLRNVLIGTAVVATGAVVIITAVQLATHKDEHTKPPGETPEPPTSI